jgi:hypothetical protein
MIDQWPVLTTDDWKIVYLTRQQVDDNIERAHLRHTEDWKRGGKMGHGYQYNTEPNLDNPSYERMLMDGALGVCGEEAAAMALGVPYVFTINTYSSAPDIHLPDGTWVEVKTSPTMNALIIRPGMKDTEVTVLVRAPYGLDGPYYVIGWIRPHEARLAADADPSMWSDPQNRGAPCIKYPMELLLPIRMLKDGTAKGIELFSTPLKETPL